MANKYGLPPGMFIHDNGVYYVRRMINGRTEKKSTGKREVKSATRRYHEIQKAWNDGASGWNEQQRVPTFARYWLDSYRPTHTLKKTPRLGKIGKKGEFNDDYLIEAPLAFFGLHRLTSITNTHCQEFANQRRKHTIVQKNRAGKVVVRRPISEATVSRGLSLVQAIFEQAIRDGLLTTNPMKHIKRPSYVPRLRVLSPEEQVKLLAALTPRFQRWVLFMLGTGLRVAEACAINPSRDIDLDARTVTVTRKTRGLQKDIQTLPLFDDDVVTVLREQLACGHPWTVYPETYRALLTAACLKAGIPHISPHVLRHTFATRYLQGGGDIYKLSLLLGHTSVTMTEQVYVHLRTTDLGDASKHIKLGLLSGPVGDPNVPSGVGLS